MQTVISGTERYWNALKEINDPEFPISLVDMGLIRKIEKADDVIHVEMTYTTTACACMQFMESDIHERLMEEPDVASVEINVVWDPPWTVDDISEEGKQQLRHWGVRA